MIILNLKLFIRYYAPIILSAKREQASRVAELFAFWLTYSDGTIDNLPNKEKIAHYEKLNRLTWELAIWIPDEALVKEIMSKLSHDSGKDIKEIVLSIREHIQKKKSHNLDWKELVSFK